MLSVNLIGVTFFKDLPLIFCTIIKDLGKQVERMTEFSLAVGRNGLIFDNLSIDTKDYPIKNWQKGHFVVKISIMRQPVKY